MLLCDCISGCVPGNVSGGEGADGQLAAFCVFGRIIQYAALLYCLWVVPGGNPSDALCVLLSVSSEKQGGSTMRDCAFGADIPLGLYGLWCIAGELR